MAKSLKIILLIILIIIPIVFYKSLNKKNRNNDVTLGIVQGEDELVKPRIALIFDNLGSNLGDLKEIYALDIPATISVIPNLKFSKNIAHIGARSGFSVFINLPLRPLADKFYPTPKYRFISSDLNRWQIESLLRKYLNSIRIAIGVNNYMGSQATQDAVLMRIIAKELKRRNLIFVDSRSAAKSVAYTVANQEGLICGYSQGFLDSKDEAGLPGRLDELLTKAKEEGQIIIIVHPDESTFEFLKDKLPELKGKVEFVTIKEYFEL